MKHLRLLRFFVSASTLISITPTIIESLPAQAQSSGCGSGWTWYITPNAPSGVDFGSACSRHDDCYDTLNADRRRCDIQFHNDMLTACREAFPDRTVPGLGIEYRHPLRITCNGAADTYAWAVRERGGKAYQDAQNRARQEQQQRESASRNTIAFKNSCSRPLRVAINFKNLQNQWETKAWYILSPGQSARLNGVDTKNRYLYYYAETTDGSNIVWQGNDTSQTIGGRVYNMLQIDTGPSVVNWTQNLTCN